MDIIRPNILDIFKTLDDDELKLLSVELTRLVFRDGVAEELHSKDAVMHQTTMKALNIDVTNRIYSVLKAVVDNQPLIVMGLLHQLEDGKASREEWAEPKAVLLKSFKTDGWSEHLRWRANAKEK